MRILIDVDGVLADLVGSLCATLPGRKPEDFTQYAFDKCLTTQEYRFALGWMAKSGFAANISWYPGAKDFVKDLCQFGEVIAVTKPFPDGPTWAWEREQWLGGHIDLVVHTACKDLVSGDILIEDSFEGLQTWCRAHPSGLGLLLRRPWNETCAIREPNTVFCVDYIAVLNAVKGQELIKKVKLQKIPRCAAEEIYGAHIVYQAIASGKISENPSGNLEPTRPTEDFYP